MSEQYRTLDGNKYKKLRIDSQILSADDVTDVPGAEYVADPFVTLVGGDLNVFFEVWDIERQKGIIAYATSETGRKWEYAGIVLEEESHLAFPYVFKYDREWYMLPEIGLEGRNELTLYQATAFPNEWSSIETRQFNHSVVDAVVFSYEDRWYLLMGETSRGPVRLYESETLRLSTFSEHPASPILKTPRASRPGGRPLTEDQGVTIFLQDCRWSYGDSLRQFRISKLDSEQCEIREGRPSPLLEPQFDGSWADMGMHHLDAGLVDHDIVDIVVDGQDPDGKWSIGLCTLDDTQTETPPARNRLKQFTTRLSQTPSFLGTYVNVLFDRLNQR